MDPIFQFSLPYPPSVNTYWRTWQGRTMISEAGRAYRKHVAATMMVGPVYRCYTCPLALSILAYPPDRRKRDLDNLLKAPLDALEKCGLFADDSQIKSIHAEMSEYDADLPDGRIYLIIGPVRKITLKMQIHTREGDTNE